MANANVSIVNANSTFDQWRINTNDLITDRNTLRNSNYVKDGGDLALANGVLSLTRGTGVTLTVTNDAAISNQLTVKSLIVTDTLTAVNFSSNAFAAAYGQANSAYGQANLAFAQANLAYAQANSGLVTPVYRNGALVATRRGINIIQSTNMTVTVSDNVSANSVDISFSSTGGGGGGSAYIDDASQNATGTGIMTKTAAGVYAARSIAGGTGISVTNGTGVSGNVTVGLGSSGVAAGTYGNSTAVPQITVDSTGRVTSVTNVAVSGGGSVAGSNQQMIFNNSGAYGGAGSVLFYSANSTFVSSANTRLTGQIEDTPILLITGNASFNENCAGKILMVDSTSAVTLTFLASARDSLTTTIVRKNTGNVTIAVSGITKLNSASYLTSNISGRYGSATVIYSATNEIILIGDIT